MEKGYLNFDEYIRQGEPSQREKAGYWQTAIGLQAVDGLKVSSYLQNTACRHIEGDITIDEARELVNQYYITKTAHDANDDDKEEADRVSSNIVKVLSSPTFDFSTGGYQSVHRRVFEGVNNKYGTLFTPYEFFYAWRKVERTNKANDGIDSLHTMMAGLFRRDRLLSVMKDFVFFPDSSKSERKIVCRYPQFFATSRLYENILEHSHINLHGDGKGGTWRMPPDNKWSSSANGLTFDGYDEKTYSNFMDRSEISRYYPRPVRPVRP